MEQVHVIKQTEKEIEKKQKIEQKKSQQMFQVAFCGHFSAGKSTVLNQLVGAEVLPTSPIPTSANIIGIFNGALGLTIDGVNGESEQWDGDIPWQKVREWGMNGGEIRSLTIHAPLPFLADHSAIFDTPGVDSTDPTHQEITLDALYQTDMIVYVMDYNHVQSETNLTFLKQLSDEKKPIYILVNQIDKHDDLELSFSEFDQSIRDTLSVWNIDYLKLMYTSMKVDNHQLNQWAIVKEDLKKILYYGKELIPYANQRLQQGYYLSLMLRLEEDKGEAIEQVKDEMVQAGIDSKQLEEREQIVEQFEKIKKAQKHLEDSFEKQWKTLVKDVTIFPYTTTELVRQWLETLQPGYRAGWLFAKKKTEQERDERLERLLVEARDKIKSHLIFPLQKIFLSFELTLLTNREEVENAIEQLNSTIDRSFFEDAVQAGPKSREYVYTFTKDRTEAFIKQLRQKSASVMDLIIDGLQEHWNSRIAELNEQLETLNTLDEYVEEISRITDAYDHLIATYAKNSNQFQDGQAFERVLMDTMKKTSPLDTNETWYVSDMNDDSSVIETDWEQVEVKPLNNFDQAEAESWVKHFKTTLEAFQGKSQIEMERTTLLNRIQRFEEQSFTISLFGAFSAGKSSFANALLGENVLPVSPHPTTATVNIVRESDQDHENRTAEIIVKSHQELSDEIKTVAKQLDLQITIESIIEWSNDSYQASTSWQKTYYSYLMTLKESIEKTNWENGSTFSVKLAELAPYVANEKHACLIKQVTLYYDCELTKKGIVLVDTPGVNSIHGRHTRVAFQQLRDSDAIFYVSYYNHSFSKADQLFLQQMAKVNDGFRHDKLYFVLNAADLADNAAELNGVKKHVYDQLVQNGVEKPRLYPLSSKKGLAGKKENQTLDPLFQKFERAFFQETIQELKQLSFTLLKEEALRYQKMLHDGIEFSEEQEEVKEERKRQLADQVQSWKQKIIDDQATVVYQHSVQELTQLFLYLRDRARYQLADLFSEMVNVSTVVGSNKRDQKNAFLISLQEWRREGDYFFEQEIQATYVRIETAVRNELEKWFAETTAGIRHSFPSFNTEATSFSSFNMNGLEQFLRVDIEEIANRFHSLKRLFEEGQIKTLKEELIQSSTEQMGHCLREEEERTINYVEVYIKENIDVVKNGLVDGLEREIERFTTLSDPHSIKLLKEEYQHLLKLTS
ncbi:dynamin family protein [Bacillus suaedae]|uniref:Dynamin family GTPase n=1 Tax=Halalkalibacter suaedae TaxID=2822140 RepID=A0A940WYX1_9BACI|nr:dynamin family protein [Bacillus suaedae]MBP3950634.1 dynamin family GTPase [Bacillus suaedae]